MKESNFSAIFFTQILLISYRYRIINLIKLILQLMLYTKVVYTINLTNKNKCHLIDYNFLNIIEGRLYNDSNNLSKY